MNRIIEWIIKKFYFQRNTLILVIILILILMLILDSERSFSSTAETSSKAYITGETRQQETDRTEFAVNVIVDIHSRRESWRRWSDESQQ